MARPKTDLAHDYGGQSPQPESNGSPEHASQPKAKGKLTLYDYVPCWNFTLYDLRAVGVVTEDLAERIAGRRKLFGVNVDADLVARLRQEDVHVPADKIELFGNEFSKVVQYNVDLASLRATPLFTIDDAASPEVLAVLNTWHSNFRPVRLQFWPARKQVLEDARAKNYPPYLGWVVGSYIFEQIKAEAQEQTVAPVLKSFLTTWSNLYTQAAAMHPFYAELFNGYAQELRLLSDNTQLVYKVFQRTVKNMSAFVKEHGPLAKVVAELYLKGNFKEEVRNNAWRIIEFVKDPTNMHT